MSWKDQLQTASFRGIKFKVDTAETRFGRRNQVHEYPNRDTPDAEDLGRKAREYNFNAYVLGDDYIKARDSLIQAIEDDKTPGTLIHPTLGRKTVVPQSCAVNFSNREGGIEYFSLVFIEAGEKKFPATGLNTKTILGMKSEALISALSGRFASGFKVSGFIEDVANKATGLLENFGSTVDGALKIGGSFVEPNYSAFRSVLSAFKGNIGSLVTVPGDLAAAITGVLSGLSGSYSSQKDIIRAQTKVFAYGQSFKTISPTTPTKIQKVQNQAMLVTFVRGVALAQIAVAVSNTSYPSKQDAVVKRDEAIDLLDQEILAAGDTGEDEIYLAMNDLKVAVVTDVNKRAVTLPNVVTVRTVDPVPSLAFAYNLYEDAKRDQEIVDRNKVRNPLFVPGGADIEVLR